MATKTTSLKFEIYQDSSWTEYYIFGNKIKINREVDLFEGKIKDTFATFSVQFDSALYSYFLSNKQVQARITINGSIIFNGIIDTKFSLKRGSTLPKYIDINLVGFTYLLRKKYKLIKKYTSKTPEYIISDLLSLVGLTMYNTPPGLSDTTITRTFDLSKITPIEIIEQLAFDCGYTGYEWCWSGVNKICFGALSYSGTGNYVFKENCEYDDHTNGYKIINEISLEKNINDIDEISVKYWSLENFTNAVLFRETTNNSTVYSCYVAISPSSYYQGNSNGVYLDLQYSANGQSYDIYNISSATLDILKDSDIIVEEQYLTDDNRYFIKIKNTNTTTTKYIYRLNVKGSGQIKTAINLQKEAIGSGNTKKEYELKYIQSQAKAQNLVEHLAQLYKYGNYKVSWESYVSVLPFGTCRLENLQYLGTMDSVICKATIIYELNKNILNENTGILVGDVITHTIEEEQTIAANPIVNTIENDNTIPATQQILLAPDESVIQYNDEDEESVYLALGQQTINDIIYLTVDKRYKSDDSFKDHGNFLVKKMAADEYYQNTNKIIYRNSNNEIQSDINAFNCKKYLIYGTDGGASNWITNITPVLRQRDTDNTSNYYIVIKTGIIAYGYTGGGTEMYDITAKIFSLGSDNTTTSQIEARWTGYIYTSNTITRPLCYVKTASKYNLVGGAYVGTDGYLRVFLYSSTAISRYYIYTEVWFNNYHYAKKIYVDNWSISYVDSISEYDTNYGIVWHKTYGDVYSEGGSITLATASLSGSSSYTRYFTLNYDCVVRAILSTTSGLNWAYFLEGVGGYICYGSGAANEISRPLSLLAGKWAIGISYSSNTSATLTLYCFKVKGYAPRSVWTAADICPTGLTTS